MKFGFFILAFTAIFVGGILIFAFSKDKSQAPVAVAPQNVSVASGKQVVEIRVKGGYQPRISLAKAGVPTVVRFITDGTFDCSSAIRIPSLGISKNLPDTGSTDIEIGSGTAGTLHGTCAMGMYPFEIQFQS